MIHLGDCRDVMEWMEPDSVDAICTDPPYDLVSMSKRYGSPNAKPAKGEAFKRHNAGFMGEEWDATGVAFDVRTWQAAYRVLKPGGHLLSFGGTRTWHRMTCAVEDAGFEVRDTLCWLYSQGMPKSLDVGKKVEGEWDGWHTGLKPGFEPILLARKPLLTKTVADNVIQLRTGALNIDGCRIPSEPYTINTFDDGAKPFGDGAGHPYTGRIVEGRFPANVLLDEGAAALLDQQQGGASRFYYCAKAPSSERWAVLACGCSTVATDTPAEGGPYNGAVVPVPTANRLKRIACTTCGETASISCKHPTQKPLSLMRWLVRLITPPGGTVLDPFLGSGTTAVACREEGFKWVGIEKKFEYVGIASIRMRREQVGR